MTTTIRTLTKIALLGFVSIYLFGCAAAPTAPTHQDITTDMIGERGIVVGQVITVWKEKKKYEVLLGEDGVLDIGSRTTIVNRPENVFNYGDSKGRVVFAHPTGPFQINSIGASPINRSFYVKQGSLTNFGMLLRLFTSDRSYYLFLVDNSSEMKDMMQNEYRHLLDAGLVENYKVTPDSTGTSRIKYITKEQARDVISKLYGKEFLENFPFL